MKDIKFRAWLADNHWAINDYDQMIDDYCGTILFETFGFFTEPDEIIYMQFTGLTDKNGKDVYEGDIYNFQGGKSYQVMFVGAAWCGGANDESCIPLGWDMPENGADDMDCLFVDDNWSSSIEVIGNIHESPELLEVES